MPYVNKPRPYKHEYETYDGTPMVKKKRAQRNKARRMLEREGVVQKGDGKDVDHKKPLSKGGTTTRSNLRAVPASKNRSFARNKDSSVK
jgi:HNH endonuclease